jgi:formylglycine-generating enzyme required for sulfatase activity
MFLMDAGRLLRAWTGAWLGWVFVRELISPAQPVVGVTWHEACAYCNWLAAQTGRPFRLPSEVELEAAARGLEGRAYAYGPQFDASRCNTFESHIRRTTPVGIFPPTPSPPGEGWGGVHDLCGNVWEWTLSLWGRDFNEPEFRYPYTDRLAEREDVHAPSDVYRVLRGGSWVSNRGDARAAFRLWYHSDYRDSDVGFRVAVPVPQL